MDIRINGQSVEATVKTLKPIVEQDEALTYLYRHRDHLDSYMARTEAGQDVLVLTRSERYLKKDDRLEIDGRPATILNVENEVNTRKEVTNFEVVMRGASKIPLPSVGYAVLTGGALGLTGNAIAAVALKTPAPKTVGTLMGVAVAGLGVMAFRGIKERMATQTELKEPNFQATSAIAK